MGNLPAQQRHHFHLWHNRALYAAALIIFVMVFGTVGMRAFEKMTWLDAFYFMSMIATAQGSAYTPVTDGGKIFAATMAFVSVGFVLTALTFLIGPLMGKLFKVGFEKFQDDVDKKNSEL